MNALPSAWPAPAVWPTRADLGGQPGHGRVQPEPEGVHWHASWEPRALAITLAAGALGRWNIDMSRAARETLADYASLGYYEIWALALERLLLERGLVGADELAAGRALRPAQPVPPALGADAVAAVLRRGSPTLRPPGEAPPPRFAVGERVCTRSAAVPHHTRLPGYARGKSAVVLAIRGRHVFADAHAQGLGEAAQWLYTLGFEGAELWGMQASEAAGLTVSIDAWEPYLQPCGQAPAEASAPTGQEAAPPPPGAA